MSHAIFVSDFPDLCYMLLVPRKAASAAGSEAGMDCGTAPAKRARLNPCGESLLRRMVARPRAPAPTADSERKAAPILQLGFARKPLKRADSVEERNLEFASPGFEFPS
jgi:hypothetical protein